MACKVIQKSRGPTVKPGTVRLWPKSGIIRLSADLLIAERFDLWIDEQSKTLWLKPNPNGSHNIWYSNKSARCAMLSVKVAVDILHLDKKSSTGVYKAEVISGEIVIDLKRRACA